jgi:hypothetical protein
MNSSDWSNVSSTVEQFAGAAGIVAGGVWAYFKFLRGRTFAYRAELTVADATIQPGPFPSVSVRVELKNAGLSKLPFEELKLIKIWAVTDHDWLDDRNVNWGKFFILTPIFEDHQWLEAGETISQCVLVPVPVEIARRSVAYRVVASVYAAPRRRGKTTVSWSAETTVLAAKAERLNKPEASDS